MKGKQLVVIAAFAVILLLSAGCEKTYTLPIPKEKLVSVLCDVHMAESAVLHLSGNQKDSTLQAYYDQIYAVHQVDKQAFDTSLLILKHDPDLSAEVYTEVLKELEALNSEGE